MDMIGLHIPGILDGAPAVCGSVLQMNIPPALLMAVAKLLQDVTDHFMSLVPSRLCYLHTYLVHVGVDHRAIPGPFCHEGRATLPGGNLNSLVIAGAGVFSSSLPALPYAPCYS
jgi:hypothetical protein